MRKAWIGALVAATLLVGIAVGAGAESIRKSIDVEYPGIKVKVNGKVVESGASQPFIVLEEGRTYVPARALAEALGGKVGWDEATKSVNVYTSRYVETLYEGDTATFGMPYYGATLVVPGGFRPNPADKTNLLNVVSGPVVAVINRTDIPAMMNFDSTLKLNLESLAGAGAAVTETNAIEPIAGSQATVEARGTLVRGAVKFRAYFIGDEGNFWIVMVSHDARIDISDEDTKQILDGFKLSR